MTTRSPSGTFAATVSDASLLSVAAQVAQDARPGSPALLSQRAFDRHVAAHRDAYPGVPTARAICMRLNSSNRDYLGWTALLVAALAGGLARQNMLVKASRIYAETELTDELIHFALQVVANELGADTFTSPDYDRACDRLRSSDRGRYLGPLLPKGSQLLTRFHRWSEVLAIGGLKPPPKVNHVSQQPRLTVLQSMELYLVHQGSLPSEGELLWFSREAGYAQTDHHTLDGHRMTWADHLAKLRARWEAMGRWCPSRLPVVRTRVRNPLPEGGIPGVPPRIKGRWQDPDECARDLLAYWDTLPPRKEPTQTGFRRWDAPHASPSSFEQHGGFVVIRDLARALRDERESRLH